LLIVDAQPIVRYGVRLFMHDTPQILAIEDADSGHEAVAAALRSRANVILLDSWLPDMLLPEAVDGLRSVSPSVRIVIFAAHLSPTLRDQALRLGVHGILGKNATPQHLREIVARVAAGEVIAAPPQDEVLRRAAEKLHRTPLTPHEHEILRRAARGESNAEIAKAVHLAPTTVKSYVQSALRKLGARNRVEAVYKLSELQVL
jgi:DNA-binding NarL/FixJ family response regulator